MKKFYLIVILCFFIGQLTSFAQYDCSNALPVCSDANSGGVVDGYGIDDFFGKSESGCLKNGLNVTTVETNSFWFRVKLAESGEFGFDIEPNNLSEDWDFAVYGPEPSCGSLPDPIACNYSKTSSTGFTGVGIDPVSGIKTDAYDNWMNVTAGDEYVVLINQYSGSNAGFSIKWKGAVIDNNTKPLDCSILVNLGPDRDLCSGQTTILNATTFGGTITYKWFKFNNSTGVYDILPNTQSTQPVNTTGRYQVEVTNQDSGQIKSDDILVTIHNTPVANTVSNIVKCDMNGDGSETFDLSTRTNDIISGQLNAVVTYHNSQTFAIAGASPIATPTSVTTPGKTIWVRIENVNNKNCYSYTSFDLVVMPPPVANQPPDLKQCDTDFDGEALFNLDNQTPIILGSQNYLVTYYVDEANAKDRKGWITDTTNYLSKSKTIWARIEVSTGSECYILLNFEVQVFDAAIANSPSKVVQCDIDNDGLFQFDLNALKDAEILGAQDPTKFEVIYFSSASDANSNTNPLPVPYTNYAPYLQEIIYARIQNKGYNECFETTSFSLQVLDTAYPNSSANIPNLSYCDDASDGSDTNGLNNFDLTERELDILNGQSSLIFEVQYFEDAAYVQKISTPTSYSNMTPGEQTIYVRVAHKSPNSTYCFADTSFKVEVKPLPNTLISPFDFVQCDADGVNDGITNFNLSQADEFLTFNNTGLNVTYHISQGDAASGINILDKNSFSNGTSGVVYARIETNLGCFRVVRVNLIVSAFTFPSNYNKILEVCDDDSTIDGLHLFNLAQVTSEILSLFPSPNLRVTYFKNQTDATLEINRIKPENAYESEIPFNQTIWVRVEGVSDGGCYGIAPVIQLKVNPRPEFELDENAVLCLNNAPLSIAAYNAKGDYNFQWKDEVGNVISSQPFANINNAGVYEVIATSSLGCESFTKQITITASNIADFVSEDMEVTDNSTNNTITISTENDNLGIGDYEFSLDDFSGFYQEDPVFQNVIPGEHTVFVREKNNCGVVSAVVYVFGFPNFFTPNEDGINDTWNILGLNPSTFKAADIHIFDRYGKLLTTISAFGEGWDGFYKHKKAISTDYWFLAEITDNADKILTYRGHFSLIRN